MLQGFVIAAEGAIHMTDPALELLVVVRVATALVNDGQSSILGCKRIFELSEGFLASPEVGYIIRPISGTRILLSFGGHQMLGIVVSCLDIYT
jgi:hypothetical protein